MIAAFEPNELRQHLGIESSLAGKLWLYQPGKQFAPNRPHIHEELEFNLCMRGQAVYLSEGRRIELKPGHIIWLFPEQDHALHRASADFQMWIAVFRPEMLQQACRQPENAPLLNSQRPDTAPSYARLKPASALSLAQTLTDARSVYEEGATDRFNAHLQLLLHDAWSNTRNAHTGQLQVDALHPGVYQAAMTLHDNPAYESLSELAAEAGISPEHLSRLFSQQMGQTMSAYRNEQRLRSFAQLIAGARWNLTEAALEAGFGSYAQCFRVLREHWGMSPSQLKAKQQHLTR